MLPFSSQLLAWIIFIQSCFIQSIRADCSNSTYGQNCSSVCSTTCLTDSNTYRLCNESDGSCFGCLAGYQGQFCQQQCHETTFGINCLQQCSTNCQEQLCDHVVGICDSCIDGKEGHFCEIEPSISVNKAEDDTVWIVVGAVVAAAVVVCVVIAVVIFMWRRRRQNQNKTQHKKPSPRAGEVFKAYNPQYQGGQGIAQLASPTHIAVQPGQINIGENSDYSEIGDGTGAAAAPAPPSVRPSTSRSRVYDHVLLQDRPSDAPNVYHDLNHYDYPEFTPATDRYDYPGQPHQSDSNPPPNIYDPDSAYSQPDRPLSSGVYLQPDSSQSSDVPGQSDPPCPDSGYIQPDRPLSSGVYLQPDSSRPNDVQSQSYPPCHGGDYVQPDSLRSSGVPSQLDLPSHAQLGSFPTNDGHEESNSSRPGDYNGQQSSPHTGYHNVQPDPSRPDDHYSQPDSSRPGDLNAESEVPHTNDFYVELDPRPDDKVCRDSPIPQSK